MKTMPVLLGSIAIVALSCAAALACGGEEGMLQFSNVQGGGGGWGDEEASRTGHLPTLHGEAEDEGSAAMPVALPLPEGSEAIIQILYRLATI